MGNTTLAGGGRWPPGATRKRKAVSPFPPGDGRAEATPRILFTRRLSPSPLLLFSPSPRPLWPGGPNVSRRGEFLRQGIPVFSPTGIGVIPRMGLPRPPSSADLFAGQPLRPRQPFDECSSRQDKAAPSNRHGPRLTDSSWQKVFSPRRFLARSRFFQAIRGRTSFFPGDSWQDVFSSRRFVARLMARNLPDPRVFIPEGCQPLAGGCGASAAPPPVARPAHAKRPRRGRSGIRLRPLRGRRFSDSAYPGSPTATRG